jgi:Type VI secretion system VasI, EvfG, VC_A0118
MRRLAVILFASCEIAAAHGQTASSTLKGLDECVAQTRKAELACDQAGGDTTTRLGCRLKAHTAEKQCLDSLFANKEQPGETPAKPRARTPPAPAAVEPPPVAAQPNRGDATAAISPVAKGWLVSETTSPRDFSPLFVAKLYALPPVAADAPETLVLRCRNQRTEMSLGANGLWRALRGGDVEVVISPDQPPARPMRWRLAVDGRTASMPQDPVDLVRALDGGRTSISVTDAAGRPTSAIFDLAGIDAVRAKLANACHWPNATVESRGR